MTMSDETPSPASIPESITLPVAEAFDVLEALEAAGDRYWNEGDLEAAVSYERLAAIIRRALGAE